MGDNEVLKATTEIKIHELRRHDGELSKRYDAIDAELERVGEHPVQRLRALYDGVHELQVVQERIHRGLDDLPHLLDFGNVDEASVNGVLGIRTEALEREIKCRRALWQHNKLLGHLLMETLNDASKDTDTLDTSTPLEPKSISAMEAPLEAQRQDAQKRIEDYFFVPCGLDRNAVKTFLENEVFQRRESYTDDEWETISSTLKSVCDAVKEFCASFATRRIFASDVVSLAKTLLVDKNEFSAEVVKLLENAIQNKVIQDELAHVLSIQLSNLNEFQWPSNGIPVVMKRAINGRYRSLIHEGAIPFLLFQYIGLTWSVFMKKQLAMLLKCIDKERQGYRQPESVAALRTALRDRLLLSALPDSADNDDGDSYDSDGSSKKASKLDILRLVCAEAHLATTLADENERRSVLAVVTDLEFFGPSVSHEVVLGIMDFIGVTDSWRRIFETHMKMPLRFPGDTTPRVLAKGVPTSRRSSRFYSELLLFTMDFAVMASSGIFLYRTHDDILLFGHDDDAVLSAWKTIHSVVDRFGLRLNHDKSGSVRLCCADSAITPTTTFGPDPLPQKPIRWGLIELQPDASIRIAEDQVEWFAMELAQKLAKTTSVLRWVTVYNKYMRFFLRNFGGVSPVFGLAHADNMIENVKHIHGIVFPETNGDVRAALIAKIKTNHPEFMREHPAELPAAWIYWPLDVGGLGLFHPLLELWSYRETLVNEEDYNNEKWTKPFHRTRERMYQYYDKFVDRANRDGLAAAIRAVLPKPESMFSIVQSTKYSETEWPAYARSDKTQWPIDSSFSIRSMRDFADRTVMFAHLISREYEILLDATDVTEHDVYSTARAIAKTTFGSLELPMPEYWAWVAYFYKRELEHVFGTTSFVTPKLLPAQLIAEIKKAGIYWS